MKRPQFLDTSYCHRFALAAASAALCAVAGQASAADVTWTGAAVPGNYNDPTKWSTGSVPAVGDRAIADGAYDITFQAGDTADLIGLDLNQASGAGVFNQSGGSMKAGAFRFGGAGASRNPTYNLSAGTLEMSSFSWGNGSNANFNVSGGTVTSTGGSLSMGVASGARATIAMTGGVFNANSVGQMNVGNSGGGNGRGTVSLSGDAQFNLDTGTMVIGQFGAASSGANNTIGTLNMADTATLNAVTVVVGGNNAGSAVDGVINLNGGTLSTGSVRKGSSNLTPSATSLVLNANGGTIKATSHGNNANFFQGLFVNLASGGLKFDTNDNFVTVTNILSGPGGLEKLGNGSLTLTALSTYTGDTTVSAGTLELDNASLDDNSTLTVAAGASVQLDHGIEDIVGSLVVEGTTYTSGTVGSFESDADVQLPAFSGLGKIRIGAPPAARDLLWTGAQSNLWSTQILPPEINFLEGANPVAFEPFDNVTFDNSSAIYPVFLAGNIQAGIVTLNGTEPYTLDGQLSGLSGTASIVMNNTSSVTLGGETSSFTGPVAVNAGVLIMGNNLSFGATSGVTIADGAQVDLNGRTPGSLYTYTIGGTGPGGTGAIVNNGTGITSAGGGVKNLVLTANASIGNDTNRFDIGGGGTVTGNGFTLTKVGNNDMGFRGNAGGSPINIVIAAGNVWAESSANAFGGATGTLTVKDGARVGTYGSLTIPTPVTLESGGRIHNQGNGTGTWSGPATLQGEVTFEGDGGPLVINGTLTGTANVTKAGPQDVTFNGSAFPGNVGYDGNTTVIQGKLTIASAALPDGKDVTVESDAILSLTHGVQDTIRSLTLGEQQVAAGIWGSETSDAPNKSPLLEGNGTLVVTVGGTPGGDYATWAAANGVDGVPSTTDSDGDGLQNGIEFVLGGDPSAPGSDSNALRPTITVDATYLNFVFRRTDDSAGLAPFVEYNSDLSAVWTEAEDGVNGVIIDEVDDGFGEGVDQVTVRIPRTLANGAKAFARLHVDTP